MLIYTRCIYGFMSNLIKESWTDSNSEANIGEACKTTVKKYIVLHDTTNRQQYFAKTQVQNRPDNLEFKHDIFGVSIKYR